MSPPCKHEPPIAKHGQPRTEAACPFCWYYTNVPASRAHWDGCTLDEARRRIDAEAGTPCPALTLGMPTYADADGVSWTLAGLRLYHDLADAEILVVDNYGCERTRQICEGWPGDHPARYVLRNEVNGSAWAKNRVFEEARGRVVVCIDSHELLAPGTLARVLAYFADPARAKDLVTGPMFYQDLKTLAGCFKPGWKGWSPGVWDHPEWAKDPEGPPQEITLHGCGFMAMLKHSWPGFHPGMKGFGGEEGYIHERVRQCGGRVVSIPGVRWWHHFRAEGSAKYPNTVEDQCRNNLIGWLHTGQPLADVRRAFTPNLPPATLDRLEEEARWLVAVHADTHPPAVDPHAGPGTELEAIAQGMGIPKPPGCGCELRRLRMDILGPVGCRRKRDELAGELRTMYRGLPLPEATRRLIDLTDPFPGLIDEACHRAKAKASNSATQAPQEP